MLLSVLTSASDGYTNLLTNKHLHYFCRFPQVPLWKSHAGTAVLGCPARRGRANRALGQQVPD